MLRITTIILTALQICGNAIGAVILLELAPLYEYVEGKVTQNEIGIKCTVVCIDNQFEKITVKIKGLKPTITNEQIAQKGGQVKVNLKNLTGKFYRTQSGEYALSCSADGMEVV